MSPIAIVAIPALDDYVWRLSSEMVPHMTFMMLGDSLDNQDRVVEFIQHVVDTSLTKFGMDVERRGLLGPQDADVLFFGQHNLQKLQDFRRYLLNSPDISKAYHSVEQYPEWTPHLTMGYPATPAKPDMREYPGITWVNFDTVALWTGDYQGVDFPLKPNELSMMETGAQFLSHHGIKGMHWGVRRKSPTDSSPSSVEVHTRPGKTVTATGGRNHPAHTDAIDVAVARQKARVSSTDALSTKELQHLVNRMNLEQQYSRLAQTDPRSKSQADKYLKTALRAGKTANDIYNFVNSPAGKALRSLMIGKAGK